MTTQLVHSSQPHDWGKHFREVSKRGRTACGTTKQTSAESRDSSGPQFGGSSFGRGGHGGGGHGGGHGFRGGSFIGGGGYYGYGWPGYYDYAWDDAFPYSGIYPHYGIYPHPYPFGEDSRAYPGGMFGAEDRTITELQALIRAKDVEMAAVDARVNSSHPDAQLVNDWHALQARYGAARAQALKANADATTWAWPDSMRTTGDTNAAWEAIIRALQPVPMTTTPGDLQDIGNRLLAKGWIPKYKVPQPGQTPGEMFLHDTDPRVVTEAIKKAIHIPRYVWIAGGVVLASVAILAVKAAAGTALKVATAGAL